MNKDVLAKNPLVSTDDLARLHGDLVDWANSLVGDKAEDAVQQSYVLMIEGKAKFDNRASLKTWSFGVVRNVCRRMRREQKVRDLFLLRSQAAETADAPAPAPDLKAKVSAAIRRLSARQQEILQLHTYREFSLEECAQILSLSLGSVRTHYHRAKENLRRELAPLKLEGLCDE